MEELEIKMRHRIDKDGFFVCDEFTDEVSDTLIEIQPKEGFYKPKWDGTKWIEGDKQSALNLKIDNARDSINTEIQKLLDTKAQEYRYDNIMSARSYAGYENPFKAEALKLSVWASNCWEKAGQIESEVDSGAREMPTVEQVISEMPIYN